MSSGRLIAVVGPSGVGKDSLVAGIAARAPGIRLVRRVITRPPDSGGEVHDAVTPEAFDAMAADGAFCVHWDAHGLQYGIPAGVLDDVSAGTDCMANFSRGALAQAADIFPGMVVLNVTASARILAARLAARGRESARDIARRLAGAEKPLPPHLDVVTIANDGRLEETVDRALAVLQPVRA